MAPDKCDFENDLIRVSEELIKIVRETAKDRFRNSIAVGTFRHTAIAKVMHQIAYEGIGDKPEYSFLMRDGSVSANFPNGKLYSEPLTMPRTVPKLSLGLISFRHPEMDYLVDQYVITNFSIPKNASMADTEAYAFEATMNLLTDPLLKRGAVIRVYHTGLEPVVIGLYRAVATHLLNRLSDGLRRRFVVIPCLFVGKRDLPPWTPKSPGALPESYYELTPWF
ncbi:MAG: hypothetical protein KDB03_05145 [Planctomycetales bacterium]|nr:hypothetical protein [Planctomycetales bacterium]